MVSEKRMNPPRPKPEPGTARMPSFCKRINGDAIELALGGVGHQPIKSGAAGLRTGEAGVHVLPGDFPFTAGNVFPKFPQLHLAVLIGG
jgi:hypothetical protein